MRLAVILLALAVNPFNVALAQNKGGLLLSPTLSAPAPDSRPSGPDTSAAKAAPVPQKKGDLLLSPTLVTPVPESRPSGAGASASAVRTVPVLMAAENETMISSQMPGKVKTINFAIGQPFRTGQMLMEFDCDEQQSRLDSVRAELQGAAQTHLAKLKLQGLGAAGELEVTLAAAAVDKAQSAVRGQEAQMALCKVMAPYDGRVARLRAKPFESVALGQPLMEIVSQSSLKAVMHVPSDWLAWMKPGTPVVVRLTETGIDHPGRISKLNSRVDAVSQTLEIEAMIDTKNASVLPGMIGTASFPNQPR